MNEYNREGAKNAKIAAKGETRRKSFADFFVLFAPSRLFLFTLIALICATSLLRAAAPPPPAVISTQNGRLTYPADDKGNHIPDFSVCGYAGGDVPIPDVPVRVVVSPVAGDNTARIQAAINYVASLPADGRGAVLLQKGRYEIVGGLKITASGVVLRGSGMGTDGTVLVAAGHDRRTLITIAGKDDRKLSPTTMPVADAIVPVGATKLRVSGASNLKPGDSILINRPCTAAWIAALGMNDVGGGRNFGWKPGSREINFDRVVTAVDGDSITIDAPITTALESEFGGGGVYTFQWAGRIGQVGIENLRCESAYDTANPKDEAHSWIAISMQNTQDAWVRQVACAHFAGSAVSIFDGCRTITVEDCKSLAPISEIAGFRRHSFYTAGQQTLFQRCYSEQGRHDFAVGFCNGGPNAFVQCDAMEPLDDSGPIDSWASGVLFDNVRVQGNAISLMNRYQNAQYAGWSAANCVVYQSSASLINCFSPPGATNWALGCWAQFAGDGVWRSSENFVKPVSLYYGQLADRIGRKGNDRSDWMMTANDSSTNPTIEQAARLIAAATIPGPTVNAWIDGAAERHPIPVNASGAKSIDEIMPNLAKQPASPPVNPMPMSVVNGWLVRDGAVVLGGRRGIQYWGGGIRPTDLRIAKPSLMRFVPGRIGQGLIEDLDALTDSMIESDEIALLHHYALWYDRRDDDHERVHRMNGDAWPPFFDLAFMRSGQGIAWDGLSKYDLTKYNPWYWDRIREFTSLCDQKGLVLMHEHFFQHNILEAGAHWASSPWRTANNINNTGFPEPPPYAGDKRIFIAEQFYDVTNKPRAALYRAYIRQCLSATADNANVIHLTSSEFTGPTHFVQFWLDTVAEWEKETGKNVMVALSAPKNVQDEILADPVRSKVVSLIEIRYWRYTANGEAFAPNGGVNLSMRQHSRTPPGSSFDQIFRAVREYRERFPDKAVLYSEGAHGEDGATGSNGWAVLLAGGSMAEDIKVDPELLKLLPKLKPVKLPNNPANQWALGDGGDHYLIYNLSGQPVAVDTAGYTQRWVKPDGSITDKQPAEPKVVLLGRKGK